MVRLREIPRTAAFAWSTDISNPYIVTGTRAGAVDADFSNETKLEVWELETTDPSSGDPKPIASISTDSRFFDLAWSPPTSDRASGIVAGALENGALQLWDAAQLKESSASALFSHTSKHSGDVKALQFNPHRTELLASAGAKGELFITDLNNPSNPLRLGTGAARADDFDAVDWNKVVPHILATTGNGGFVTMWDIKAKKESLTLNNHNRTPASAVAWNPDWPTKLATAAIGDQDPVILMWDLRNAGAPERILKGHGQGILSLSWCGQDSSLLLSCGKDNRTICWDTHTGNSLGEFPIVTNWTFQTRWSPRHPNLLATASFDGKIAIQSIQNTNPSVKPTAATQVATGEDFFANVQTQPQTSSFSLPTPPQWLKRPVGATYGFGGKIVRFEPIEDQPKKSKIEIVSVSGDEGVSKAVGELQDTLKKDDLTRICEEKATAAASDEIKNDWKVIGSLVSENPRTGLLDFLGFSKSKETAHVPESEAKAGAEAPDASKQVNGTEAAKSDRLSSFFDNAGDNQSFLADLASSKGAKANNPFKIYTGSESEVDKTITRALTLGSFEDALDLCLAEKRMSDAFMIAVCGGQKCIDKVQAAYFAQQSQGPNYLRLLASVVGKDLWDVVYNADLNNWQEVMATLCTYADQSEFPDLCEALGDRLDESQDSRNDASFCYLAGSKLEKVVPIWIREMKQAENEQSAAANDESAYSIHVDALQDFIEKVTIFRKATNYQDAQAQDESSKWKLEPLYALYAEYADVVATYGFLELADEYLSLLPAKYSTAQVARDRVSRATRKAGGTSSGKVPVSNTVANTGYSQAANMQSAYPQASPLQPSSNVSRYGVAGYQQLQQPYQPAASSYGPANTFTSGYVPQNQNVPPGPPPQAGPPTTTGPPKAAGAGGNWNDLPEAFNSKPSSRRGTPGPGGRPVIPPPFASQAPNGPPQPTASPPMMHQPPIMQQRTASPVPPPPKAGQPRMGSPVVTQPAAQLDQSQFHQSSAASSYAPAQSQYNASLPPQASLPARTQSPYNAPPVGGAPSNRYAPAPGAQQTNYTPAQYGPGPGQPPPQQTPMSPPRAPVGPPPMGPPPTGGPGSRPSTAQGRTAPTAVTKYPAGDRSHIATDAMPIFEILNTEMQRIQSLAPAKFKADVDDTAKRVNLLFDALNNAEISPQGIALLQRFTRAMQARDFNETQAAHTELIKQIENGGLWAVGLKRLMSMSRATPV